MTWTRASILIFVAIAAAAPYLAGPDYSIVQHSLYQLGAQGASHSYLIKIAFVVLGLGVALDAARYAGHAPLRVAPLFVFGVSLMASAAFATQPIDPGAPFKLFEAQTHAFLTMLAFFSFALAAVAYALCAETRRDKWAAIATAFAATFMPMFMFMFGDVSGVMQRVMLGASLLWLAIYFPPRGEELSTSSAEFV